MRPGQLRAMPEREFIAAWVSELGQPPALMLERGEMIELLLAARVSSATPTAGRDDLLRAA